MIAKNPDFHRPKNRREVHRVDVLGDLNLILHDERSRFNGDAMNLSANGIHFLSLVKLPMFHEIAVTLQMPKAVSRQRDSVQCHGVVVRCEKRVQPFFEISLFFIDMQDADKAKIQRYMDRVGVAHPLGPI